MVLIRRNESNRRAYIAVARAGLIICCVLIFACGSVRAELKNQIVSGDQAHSSVQQQAKASAQNDYSTKPSISVLPAATTIPKQSGAPQESQKPENLAKGQAAQNSKENEGFWNGKFTDWAIVGLTFGLLVVGGVQARIYYLQSILMRAALKETRRSNATSLKSTKITERTLVDLERPYVFVFGIAHIASALSMEGSIEYPIVRCSISNNGRLPAIIAKANYFIEWSSTVPPTTESIPNLGNLNGLDVLAIGEKRNSVEIDLSSIEGTLEGCCGGEDYECTQYFESWVPKNRPRDDIMSLFLRVIISYSGPFSRNHETSACWRYDIAESCFRAYGNEQYNYTK